MLKIAYLKKNNEFLKCFIISLVLFSNVIGTFQQKLNEKPSLSFGPLTQESDIEIKNSFEKLKNYILTNKNYTYSSEKSFLKDTSKTIDHKDGIICKVCLKIFSSIQGKLLKKFGWSVLFEFLSLLCSLGLNSEVCDRYINAYGDIVTSSLIEHYLNAEYICTFTSMCYYKHFVELKADDFAWNILADKPKLVNSEFSKINMDAPVWKVLHVADIHVDLQYEMGSRGVCPYQLCCRKENHSINSNSPNLSNLKTIYSNVTYNQQLAGKYGFIGKCDIPLITLENFAEKVFNEIKPDFIIWTGDNPGHDPDDKSALEVAKIFTEIIKIKYNYSLPVYPSLGNHEKYPSDEYNPFNSTKEQEFLTPYGDIFKDWIGNEAYFNFIKTGAYTKLHAGSNLRIISTNCMLCDSLNFYLIKNPTDPQSQIQFMEKTLRQAEKDGEVVYLISHIPPGDSSFLSECAKRLKALIERFSHIIRGQFYGHTHYDEIKIMTEYFDKSRASSIGYIAPSLTTYSNLLPSFRIFEVDSESKWVRDYTQYHLNVTKANENEHTEWEIFYKATQLFNVRLLNETQKIYERIQSIYDDKEFYKRLLSVFFTDGPLFKEYLTVSKMQRYLRCRYTLDVFEEYFKCIGYITWDSEEYAYALINVLTGSWYERIPQ